MKTKQLFITAFFLISLSQLKAQGPFFGFGVGYGVPISGTILGYNSEDNNVSNTFFTENVRGSFGKGMNFNLYGGYMVNENIGLELAANYLVGSKYTFTNVDINTNSSSTSIDEMNVTSFRLIPGFRIGFGENKVRYYTRLALAIGLVNKLTDNYNRTSTNPGGTDVTYESFEYTGGKYIGFSGGFGLTYNLSDNIALYGELTRYFISWGATNGELTAYTFNGSDQLGNLTTDQKKYEYVDRIDQSMNNNSGEPTKQLKSYTSMNSLGLNIGLHFTF